MVNAVWRRCLLITAALLCSSRAEALHVDLRNTLYACDAYRVVEDCRSTVWADPTLELMDGKAVGLSPAVGVVSVPVAQLVEIAGDASVQAALVADTGGGAGICMYVYVFRDGHCVAAETLGDRTRVSSMDVVGDSVHVSYRKHALGDSSCCPSEAGERTLSANP